MPCYKIMWIIQGCYLLVDANSNQIHLHYFLLEKVLGFQTDLHVISLPEGIVVKCWGTSVLMRQPWEEAINRWSGHNCIRQRSMVLKKNSYRRYKWLGPCSGKHPQSNQQCWSIRPVKGGKDSAGAWPGLFQHQGDNDCC